QVERAKRDWFASRLAPGLHLYASLVAPRKDGVERVAIGPERGEAFGPEFDLRQVGNSDGHLVFEPHRQHVVGHQGELLITERGDERRLPKPGWPREGDGATGELDGARVEHDVAGLLAGDRK